MQLNQTIDKLKDYDFLRTILTNLPAVAFVIAPDGTILFAEGKGVALAGLKRDDVLGTNVSEYFSQYPGFEDRVRRVLEGETITSTVIAPSQRSLEVTHSPMRDDRGSICGVIGVAQDVTERIEQEQALRERESWFRAIFESARDSIFIKDRSFRYVQVSPAMEQLFGLPARELVGRTDEDLFGPEAGAHLREVDARVLDGEVVEEEDTKPVNGEPRSFHVIKAPMRDAAGTITGICGIARDITERKRAERQLRDSEEKFSRAFQSNAALMAITHIQTSRLIDVNETFVKILGFTRDEAVGRTAGELGLFVDMGKRQAAANEVEKGRSVRNFEATVRAKSGELRYGIFSAEKIVLQGADCMMTVMVDITERKQAEQTLAESEQKFRTLFENMQEGVALHKVIYDEHGHAINYRILSVNPAYEKHTGISPDIARGKLATDLYGTDSPPYLDRWAVVADTGVPNEFETYFEPMQKYFRISAVSPARGTFATVFLDITEQKRQEVAINGREEKLRSIFRVAPIGIGLVKDRVILDANERLCQMTGYSRDELLGQSARLLYPTQEEFEYVGREKYRQISERGTGAVETRWQHKDGLICHIALSSTPLDASDPSKGVTFTALDITERKRAEEALRESEEKFRRIFDEGPLGMAMAGKDFRFIRVNTALCRMLGYTASELTSLTFKDITHPDHLSEDSEFVQKAFRGEIPRYHTEKRYICKNRETIWGALTLSTIRSNGGQFLYFLSMIEDITERKRAQEEKEWLQQQLQQSQKLEAIGTMAGGIAHDFNNILTGILGFTELVRSEIPEDSEIYDNLAEVVKAGRRARDLVKQILSFSRRAETEKSLISLVTIVKEALKLIRSVTPSHISIKQNFTASPTRAILADPTQMHQVVLNLCINAADAMPDGGVLEISLEEVQVETESRPEQTQLPSGCYFKLTVRDNGAGMSPEVRERVFEPYFTTKQVGKGTGMGLAVVHGVVKEHGGSIAVSSEPGEGAAFEVYLPIAEATLDAEVVSAPVVAAGSEAILFVDDESMITNLQRSQLGKWGYRVTATENSATALGIFRASPRDFDLVITDQSMPGLTGVKLAQAIHEISPSTPIILCTGFDEGISRENADMIGIRAILSKPITGAEFSCTIRMVLDEASMPSQAKS
jgi:PAS domain S-box-containing protein